MARLTPEVREYFDNMTQTGIQGMIMSAFAYLAEKSGASITHEMRLALDAAEAAETKLDAGVPREVLAQDAYDRLKKMGVSQEMLDELKEQGKAHGIEIKDKDVTFND
jgi:hypothetical protein